MEKDGELGSAQRPGKTVEGQQIEGGGRVICLKLEESGGDKKALPLFSNIDEPRKWKLLRKKVVNPSRPVTGKGQALRNKTD